MTARIQIKVNISGPVANLVWCDASDYQLARDSCEALALAAGHPIRFRVIDVAGGDLEHYGPPKKGAAPCWHEPPFHLRSKRSAEMFGLWQGAVNDLYSAGDK